jgi:hypothetical protein
VKGFGLAGESPAALQRDRKASALQPQGQGNKMDSPDIRRDNGTVAKPVRDGLVKTVECDAGPSAGLPTFLARCAIGIAGALGMLVASTRTVEAQSPPQPPATWEIRFTSGGLFPTGAARDVLKDATMSAAQVSYLPRPAVAITATFGWAQSRDLASVDEPKLDVFSYDLGVEARASQWFAGHAVTFNPFVGVGAGGRSYTYRKLDFDATHNLAGYGAAGGEFGIRRVHVRLEVRDYVAGFKPLQGTGDASTRNDVVVMVGLRFTKH